MRSSAGKKSALEDEALKDLVKELVRMIKRDLTVDWTNNEVIKARIRANARLLLVKNEFPTEESEGILDLIYDQAISLYRDYVPSAAN